MLAACLAEPTFITSGQSTSAAEPEPAFDGRNPPQPVDEPMVRIAMTQLGAAGGVAPKAEDAAPHGGQGNGNGKGKGNGNGNGNGKGKGGDGGGGDNGGGGDAGSSPSGGSDASAPPATRLVPAFWIDAYEVGVASYVACVTAGACPPLPTLDGCTASAGLAAHPVTCVPFEAAHAYCIYRGKRLLSDDEWLAAAGGAPGRRFPWGNETPSAERLNACGPECSSRAMYTVSDGYAGTAPRGIFTAGHTPEGVFDLAGNAAEWVTSSGGAPALRGGSFEDSDPSAVATSALHDSDPTLALPTVGFRCARDDR